MSAARSSDRGTIASIASDTCSRRTCSPSPQPAASNSTSTAAASLEEALASFGWRRTVSLSASRCALPSSSLVISRSSSSKASSVALASRYTAVASSVASFREGGCRFNRAGRPAMPYRASSSSRRCGTAVRSSVPNPAAVISATRSSALTIAGPDAVRGPRRHRSNSDTRAPSGISSSNSSAARCREVSSPYRVSHSRCVAASRTRATSRASVVTPGSSTRRSRSQATASVKIAVGPSPVVHARASTHATSAASTSAKSVRPSVRWISH